MKKIFVIFALIVSGISYSSAAIITLREGDTNASYDGNFDDGYFNEDTLGNSYEGWKNNSNNSSGTAIAGTTWYHYGLTKFDLTQLDSGLTITNATLTFSVISGQYDGTGTVNVSEYLNSWNETSGVSLNQIDTAGTDYASSPIATIDLETAKTNGTFDIDITTLLQDWYSGTKDNNGITFTDPFQTNESAALYWHSSESSTINLRPILTITTAVPEPNTASIFFMGALALGALRRKRLS
jgi:hypothetical protein